MVKHVTAKESALFWLPVQSISIVVLSLIQQHKHRLDLVAVARQQRNQLFRDTFDGGLAHAYEGVATRTGWSAHFDEVIENRFSSGDGQVDVVKDLTNLAQMKCKDAYQPTSAPKAVAECVQECDPC